VAEVRLGSGAALLRPRESVSSTSAGRQSAGSIDVLSSDKSPRSPDLPKPVQSPDRGVRSPAASWRRYEFTTYLNDGYECRYGNPAAWQALVKGAASVVGTPIPAQVSAVVRFGPSANI